MIQKLAESKRAEQVFVRHAFRFWMGRNETLNDAPVLQEAYRAYKHSGGSMKALLTSLLTSDVFLYRTMNESALATLPSSVGSPESMISPVVSTGLSSSVSRYRPAWLYISNGSPSGSIFL